MKISPYILIHESKFRFCFFGDKLLVTQSPEDEEEKVFVDGAGDIPVWDIHMETELDNFKPKVCPLHPSHIPTPNHKLHL
jgi:hypothetical protein